MNRPKTVEQALDVWGGNRPKILPKVVTYYDHDMSVYPDSIRISFDDGSTAVYELRREETHPVILRNIEIIKKMKAGYVNQPMRRRRKA